MEQTKKQHFKFKTDLGFVPYQYAHAQGSSNSMCISLNVNQYFKYLYGHHAAAEKKQADSQAKEAAGSPGDWEKYQVICTNYIRYDMGNIFIYNLNYRSFIFQDNLILRAKTIYVGQNLQYLDKVNIITQQIQKLTLKNNHAHKQLVYTAQYDDGDESQMSVTAPFYRNFTVMDIIDKYTNIFFSANDFDIVLFQTTKLAKLEPALVQDASEDYKVLDTTKKYETQLKLVIYKFDDQNRCYNDPLVFD